MNKGFTLAYLFITILVNNCYSQLLSSEQLYNKVVLLKSGNNFGSGFILYDENGYFLVTAKHVADSLRIENTIVYFRSANNKAIECHLKYLIPSNSVTQFNDNADIFILKITPFDSLSKSLLKRVSFEGEKVANDRNSLSRQYDVVVMGYPVFDTEHFSPISFRSNLSSGLMNIEITGLPKPCYCYFLENPGMQGFSGGPVFIGVSDRILSIKPPRTLIIGKVTANTGDNSGGKLAVITPMFHLLDLIKTAPVKMNLGSLK